MSTRNSVATTYGGAAWLVICGVLASWLFLKQDANGSLRELPTIPDIAAFNKDSNQQVSLLARAEAAFAAGRITRPQGDSALDLYRAHLKTHPQDSQGIDGLKRVTRYLVGTAEAALRQADWNAAQDFARQALAIDAKNAAGRSVLRRVKQQEEIVSLTELALQQLEQDNLTKPKGANALESYQAVLKRDPDNATAKQGLQLIAQRLASLAQAEAIADRTAEAKRLIASAKKIAPNAPGIEAAEKLASEWKELTTDQAVKDDLVAAAQASEAGRLIASDAPGQLGALDFYRSALEKDPDSAAAAAGVSYIARALLERARDALDNEQTEGVAAHLDNALDAGADERDVRDLQDELAYLERRARILAGDFNAEDTVSLSELTVRRSVQPIVDDGVKGGTVDIAFTVSEKGDVADIEILNAASERLEQAAVTALNRWRFEPYKVDGRVLPIRTSIRLRIET